MTAEDWLTSLGHDRLSLAAGSQGKLTCICLGMLGNKHGTAAALELGTQGFAKVLNLCLGHLHKANNCEQKLQAAGESKHQFLGWPHSLMLSWEEMHSQVSRGRSHLEPSSHSLPTVTPQPEIPNIMSLGETGREEAVIP